MPKQTSTQNFHENRETRSYRRIPHSAPIQFVSENSYRTYHATMKNYSSGGMYLEANRPLIPGKDIRISMSKYTAQEKSGPEIFSGYFGRIVWCTPVTSKASSVYGAGIEYDYPVYFHEIGE
ncbi:PilZ domain-containing protein [Desulfoplanes sp.]